MVADRGPSGGRLENGGGALHDATACAPTGSGAAEGFSQLLMGVPPVGVEPTLGTLLGGRPLPLGYGGGFIIPPVQLPNRGVAKTISIIWPGSRVYCIQIAERS